ncbi:MAG TPA: alcohol dehydrogenase catalytic domain-containing protein [Conexibacter sp.]|jgi:threonine dehydrogenase-like Zn-dependent dehydrogenase|nr:alcohol dehydrogenase catalytic domain-containing protein [Conexibacter sp.]
MKALAWHGRRDVRVDDVPDPRIEQPTDAIIRVTSSGLCGSDLHLYEVLGPSIDAGDVLGHEPMGIVEKVGAEVEHVKPGDRVVIPFNISCGHCFMCEHGLQTQCETTQVRDEGMGAALFGYTKPNAGIPGELGQALPLPAYFEQAAQLATEDALAESIACGPDPERHLEFIRRYAQAGYDHIFLHQVGPDQDGFVDFFERERRLHLDNLEPGGS